MLYALRYYHRYYLRSYRFAAPLTVCLGFIFFLYGIVPNPVMDSYAVTATLMFLIAAWLCFGFIDLEDETQQILTFLHSGKIMRLYALKLLYLWMFSLPLSVFAIVYPIIFDKFDHAPTVAQVLTAFLCHQIAVWLGIAVAAWFNRRLFRSGMVAFLVLCLVLTAALGGQGIVNRTSPALGWLIPPFRMVLHLLSDRPQAESSPGLAELLYPILYIILLVALFLYIMQRRRFESRAQ
ncbi:hypothetical protein [Paenibacillus sp. NFR01]|uniref:hypothetical protein n=1 Tax=Paenibacillus sp. NFR01 TaxID=1566279 RepID=UPI0008C1D7CC|nr:hypothetical protein [Paenibacillus sp. NFR01]SET86818.1 hypothetical protein SAMN03159358_2497 [Paenibacillus sp. NFR01]